MQATTRLVRKRKRTGFSLIELVAVISMMATVLALTATTFHLLLRSEKSVSQSFVTERAVSRLAVLFRDDVHQSESGVVTAKTDSTRCELALGDANGVRVRYVETKEGLARLIFDGDTMVARDDFRLTDCHVRITAGDDPGSFVRSLVIERPGAAIIKSAKAVAPLRKLEIQAYLNRLVPRSSDEPKSDRRATEESK